MSETLQSIGVTFIPITRENIYSLKAGEWIWDDKMVARRKHGRSIYLETITEPIGFRQIHILDLKEFGTVFTNCPFMLSDIDDDRSKHRWVCFEEGRFYKFKDVTRVGEHEYTEP